MGNFNTLMKFLHPYEIARDEVKSNEFSEEVDKLVRELDVMVIYKTS